MKSRSLNNHKQRNLVAILFLIPSLFGFFLFYLFPFLFSVYDSFINNNIQRQFVGFQNYIETLSNPLFLQASGNMITFIGVSVPLSVLIGLSVALCVKHIHAPMPVIVAILLPMMVPSGSMVFFWRMLEAPNGLLNQLRQLMDLPELYWSRSPWIFFFIVIIFVWKNAGYSIILYWTGLTLIPQEYYDAALAEGARSRQIFRYVTWFFLKPTTYVVVIMSLINSFKVFREIYLLYGNYPYSGIYMLQHYMNNQFLSANIQNMTTAGNIMFSVLGLILIVFFYVQERQSKDFF